MKAKSAERYAQALIDLGQHEEVQSELVTMAGLLEKSVELREVFFRNIFTQAEKRSVLDQCVKKLRFSGLTENFLRYLIHKNRFYMFFDVRNAYERILNTMEKRENALVISAVPVAPSFKEKIRKKFETLFGRKLTLIFKVESSLLGGVIVRIGDHVFDGSVKAQLHDLEEQLERGV